MLRPCCLRTLMHKADTVYGFKRIRSTSDLAILHCFLTQVPQGQIGVFGGV